jgi:putative tryptophan/tyrosine transport system substrate-binding protein
MRRRKFITLMGGAAAAWPLAAFAQQTMPVVAFLDGGLPETSLHRVAAFRNGLSEMGYVDGQNVTVEYHWLEGHYDRLPALIADLVRRDVSVITTPGLQVAALAAKAATATIPIVFGVATDPVTLGLVASLARPGGNATGINFFVGEINAKRLGLMHEFLPKAVHFAVLVNPADAISTAATTKAVEEAARTFGLEILFLNASTPTEIDAAFATISRQQSDALFIAADGYFASRASQFAVLAARDRIPASFSTREMVDAGLLMSYGVDFVETFHQIGNYVGRILKGEKPADLPVQQATKFEFAINMRTAKALGLEVPPNVLALADDVIE